MDNKIKKLVPLAQTKFLSLYTVEYENKIGSTKHWTVASRKDFETLNGQYFEGRKKK